MKKISILLFILLLSILNITAYNSVSGDDDRDYVIVSFGDSYSSGEGVEPFYGQDKELSEKVKDHDWLAHRSKNSWPGMLYLIDDNGNRITMNEHKDENWYFVATSGAITDNLLSSKHKHYTQRFNNYITVQPSILSGDEYIAPQIEAIDKVHDDGKKVDYVTMTMGGNDVGFVSAVTAAVVNNYNVFDPNGLNKKINDTWTDFYKNNGPREKIYNAYKTILERLDDESVLIIAGYPLLVADDPSNDVFFNDRTAAILNSAVHYFNVEINKIVDQCKREGYRICFAPVEEEFTGHGAYSRDPWINDIKIGSNAQDIDKVNEFISAYSMHPNYAGCQAYARCVQKKINEIEEDGGQNEFSSFLEPDDIDVVMTLDVSGSMSGTPIEKTKDAAKKFVDNLLEKDATSTFVATDTGTATEVEFVKKHFGIGLVTYSYSADKISGINTIGSFLNNSIDEVWTGGDTNIEDGLKKAKEILDGSQAKKKIIVLMSDGMPNVGKVDDELIEYAQSIKDEGIQIYALGYFEDYEHKMEAEALMNSIASEGFFYNIAEDEMIKFVFDDISDVVNGQPYTLIRIACPVDVTVTYNGETLSSKEKDYNTRTSFGTLTFEQEELVEGEEYPENYDNRIKVLRLKDTGVDYDIEIEGNGKGTMDYTIGFMNEDGEYEDMRKFRHIPITRKTIIDTVASSDEATVLNIDEDGDGRYDLAYKANPYENGKIVNDAYVFYITAGIIGAIILIINLLSLRRWLNRRKKYREIIGG